VVLLYFAVAGSGPVWAECDTSICSGNPCTITGTHTIDDWCDLDFGGTDVTIAGTAVVEGDGNWLWIEAHSLTVSGTLRARAGMVDVTVTGNFVTNVVGTSPGTVDLRDGGTAGVQAGGSCTLNGKNLNCDDTGSLEIDCAGVTGSSAIHCDGAVGEGGAPSPSPPNQAKSV
jgi:hypothetical protein